MLPNQPVIFGDDININKACRCAVGKPYMQPVLLGDITTFQLRNMCDTIITQGFIQTIDLSAISSARQGTGNGNSGVWAFDGSIHTPGNSKILNIGSGLGTVGGPDLIISGKTYKFGWTGAVLCPGHVLILVGYKTYSGDASSDYDILETVTPSGSGNVEFTAARNYTRLGWIISGSCPGEDEASFTAFTLDELHNTETPGNCPVFCIRDLDGNHVTDVPDPEASGGNLIYKVDWSTLGIASGCYKICLCEGDFIVDNLFTDGDNGTMEANITGIASGIAGTKLSPGYEGLYSFSGHLDTGLPATTLLTHDTQLLLGRRKIYKASARVYIDDANDPGSVDPNTKVEIILNGFSGAEIISRVNLIPYQDNQSWFEVNVVFKTGAAAASAQGFIEVSLLSANSPTGTVTLPVSVDKVLLFAHDPDSYCSQTFSLRDAQDDCTVLIQYENSTAAFGFVYPEGFEFSLRVKGDISRPKYTGDDTSTTDSAGLASLVYSSSRKIYQLFIADAPQYIHDAIALAMKHQTFKIDGVQYIKQQGDYTPIWRNKTDLASAIVDISELFQENINSYC